MNDIYYGYLLTKNAKDYGLKNADAYTKFLSQKAKDEWITNFSGDDWSYSPDSKGKGLTLEGLKVAEMMAYLTKQADIKTQVDGKLGPAINKLLS